MAIRRTFFITLLLMAPVTRAAEPPADATVKPAHETAVERQKDDLPTWVPCSAYRDRPRPMTFRLERLKDVLDKVSDDDMGARLDALTEMMCLLEEGADQKKALSHEDTIPLLIEALRQVGRRNDDFLSELMLIGSLRGYREALANDRFLAPQVMATLLHRSDNSRIDVVRWVAARTLSEIFAGNEKLPEILRGSAEKELGEHLGKPGWGNALAVGFMKRQLADSPSYSPFFTPEGARSPKIKGLDEFAEKFLTEEQKRVVPVRHHFSLVFLDLR